MRIDPKERRDISNEKIKKMGIVCLENLPLIEDSSQVELKNIDEICQRAIACLLSIQLACDIAEGNNYEDSKALFSKLLKEYGVEKYLIEKEKKLFEGNFTNQDVIDVTWTYEAYWSLVWALGLVDNIEIPSSTCDCEKAIRLVGDCESYEKFKNNCNLRDIEEILDMLDLHYRYHWACVEKRINPSTKIGILDPDVVVERRRGLEWLISNENDWNEISLNT